MPLARHHRKWETVGVIALLALVGGAFAYTLFVVLKPGPDPLLALAPSDPSGEPVVERTMEARRQYQRSLSVHTAQDTVQQPSQHITRVEDYGSVGLDLPARSATSLDALPATPAVPVTHRNEDRRERTREQDRPGTGWGWLADDIAASRENRASTEALEQDASSENAEQEGALEHRTMMDSEPGAFDPATFNRDREERAALRPVLRNDTPETISDPRRSDPEVSAWDMPGTGSTGLDSDRAAIGFAGESLDAMLGLGNVDGTDLAAGQATGTFDEAPLYRIASVNEGQSMWQSDTLASPWQGARSDDLFHAGGGYQPARINAGRPGWRAIMLDKG